MSYSPKPRAITPVSPAKWSVLYSVEGDTDVPVDAATPNAEEPPEDRVFRASPITPTTPRAMLFVADGTSLAFEVWLKDETSGRWWRNTSTTLTAATSTLSVAIPPGALFFFRIVTNTGNVKNYAVSIQ